MAARLVDVPGGCVLFLAATLSWGADVAAQDVGRPVMTIRGGVTHPPPCLLICGDYGDSGFGIDVEGGADLAVKGPTWVYGTFSWYRLRFSDRRTHDGLGFGAGVRFGPTRNVFSPWVGAGVLLHRRGVGIIAPSGARTEIQSAFGPGWEMMVGWGLPLSEQLTLSPALQYRSYRTDVDVGAVFEDSEIDKLRTDTSFFTISLGLRVSGP